MKTKFTFEPVEESHLNNDKIKDFLKVNKSLLMNNDLKKLYENSLANRRGVLTDFLLYNNIDIFDYLSEIPTYCFYCSLIENLEIPSTVVAIQDRAFKASAIKHIIIPGSVEVIGERAFFNSELQQVEIRPGVKMIDDYAFALCKNLNYISIPNSVTYLGKDIFLKCHEVVVECHKNSKILKYCQENNIKYLLT